MSELAAHALRVSAGPHTLLDDVSLRVTSGEVVALVGPSGSGKSLTLRSLLDLLPMRPGRTGGRVCVDGVERSGRSLRGEVSLLFQDARASLDPLRTVRHQVETAASLAGLEQDVLALLGRLAFDNPEWVASRYPHELSGGMAQRVAIAVAIARRSRFLLCDEPTTGLDAPVQRDLVRLLRGLPGVGIVFVTHDLRLLPGFADRIYVIDGGRVVEEATTLAKLQGAGARLVEATSAIAAPGWLEGGP
ncbi:MAG: ABC transporter ATP-binding protein [Myxococcales bacterium]|nr:ABC transporter ATP-binding protein [Myxococcales bacterium]